MADICKSYANTGQNYCAYLGKVLKRIMLYPEFDGSGTKNEIATVGGVTAAALQALCEQADIKKRLFPLPLFENVEEERAENTNYEYEGGTTVKIKDGVYSFKGIIPFTDGGPSLLGRLQDWHGQDFGIYGIDEDGNFRHEVDSTGILVQTFMVDGGTWSVRMIYGKYSEPMGIEVMFNFKPEVNDKNQTYIPKADLDFDGRTYSDLYALRDVTIAENSNSLTTLNVTITTDHGIPVTGLAKTDMYLYNTTDSAETTISTSTEVGVTGVYALVFASETEADAYSLNLLATSKYDPADTLTGTWNA